jgi:hypothetical protein
MRRSKIVLSQKMWTSCFVMRKKQMKDYIRCECESCSYRHSNRWFLFLMCICRCKIFNVSIVRVQFVINVKTHSRVFLKFIKQMKIALIEAQRDRYKEISSEFLYNDDVQILNIVVVQQKDYCAHFFISNVVL